MRVRGQTRARVNSRQLSSSFGPGFTTNSLKMRHDKKLFLTYIASSFLFCLRGGKRDKRSKKLKLLNGDTPGPVFVAF